MGITKIDATAIYSSRGTSVKKLKQNISPIDGVTELVEARRQGRRREVEFITPRFREGFFIKAER